MLLPVIFGPHEHEVPIVDVEMVFEGMIDCIIDVICEIADEVVECEAE